MSERADGSYSRAWRKATTIVLPPAINALMGHEWRGQQNVPREGGLIIAANHLSYADVLAVALFTHGAGRYPVYLAKSSLFEARGLGTLMRKLGQLPVYRGQVDAALVLRDAEQGIRSGACVVFYPEATVTRDPGQWPMVAKTGVARLALATGAPVIPLAHWEAQRILPYGSFRPHLVPRTTVRLLAGPPVDLSEFAGRRPTSQVLRAATARIMAQITRLLAEIRGETPPDEPYHPAVARRRARQALRESHNQARTNHPPDSPSGPGCAGAEGTAGDGTAGDGTAGDGGEARSGAAPT